MILFYTHSGKDATRESVVFSDDVPAECLASVHTSKPERSELRPRAPKTAGTPHQRSLICSLNSSAAGRHAVFHDEATSVASFRVSARVPAGQTSFSAAAVVPVSKNNKLRLTHAPPVSASEGSVSVKFEILRCKSRGGKVLGGGTHV